MKRHRLLKILFAASLLLVLLAALAWFFPQQVLTMDSGPVKADVLVVMGGTPDRAVRAAELFKQGAAPKVLVSGLGDNASNRKLLEQNGVTNTAIILENKSHTTRENAEFSIPMLRALGARRVIIVTSWYHSRRALMCFEHYAPDIQFYSRPSYFGYVGRSQKPETLKTEMLKAGSGNKEIGKAGSTNFSVSEFQLSAFKSQQKAEWKRVRGYANSEYYKLLGYWVCYGVGPL
jgi:uncharacterized SAM-binding protein YcdF (DUF218 family)